ncbi:MAG: response regulator transcription factor [Bacteroidales bacterium]|nr:response regulator transcription factor [Bacteroidales bacterium]
MIKTIIIDDEINAREIVAELLENYCENVSLIGQADSVESGLKVIRELKPELVFLDIKLTDGTGFDLLRQLENIDFKIIFITAYEEYAIKAFKFSALDYLLKPIDINELIESINKAEELIQQDNISLKLDTFFSNIDSISKKTKKIILKTTNNIHLVNINEIVRCESDRNYTHFYFLDKDKIVVSKTLKEYETLLSEYGFFRVHHSHLINLQCVEKLEKTNNNFVVMKDNSKVPVAFRKKEELIKLFKNL